MGEPKLKGGELRAAFTDCRSHFLAVALFSLAVNVLYLSSPLYLLQIYDRVIPSGSLVTLVMVSAVLLAAVATLASLDALRTKILLRASVRLDRLLADRVVAASVASRTFGGVRTEALRDFDAVRQYLTGGSLQAAFDLPWVPIYIAIIFVLSPALGAFALGCALLLVLMALTNEWATRRALRETNDATTRSYNFVEASLRNSEVITALGMVDGLVGRWRRDRNRLLNAQSVAGDRAATISSIIKFLRLTMQSAILGVGAYLVIERATTAGAIFAASVILSRALQPIEVIVGAWRNSVAAAGSYRRLNQTLMDNPESADQLTLPRPAGRLTVEGLYFSSPNNPRFLLNNISFQLEAGEVLGIIGPSGAGKSTLARHIVGVLKPRSGAVRIDGADVANWPHRTLGEHLGYLPQDVELFADTVATNISRFRLGVDAEIVRAARRARAHDLILRLPDGYKTVLGEGSGLLSGGHRQRVALARAVFGSPALIVLDEPSSNLDLEGDAALNACIDELRQLGTTLIIISHRPATLALVDKILVLRDGAVEAFGERTQLLARFGRATPLASAPPHDPRTVATGS